nr:immunoglobulin light chain junction region [Macaca mulatta]MOW28218.1 immunoglobulin light chain junction region [Macaca mulatta]MOW28519.1 immunoglobulin light chain junction region [Macaca mulatta]MOW29766.1 immunoglobulin light chain junction region [Macaca mulatta]MOW29993.1 immunoglobulin light chain junction region [Macaca mulatta]
DYYCQVYDSSVNVLF